MVVGIQLILLMDAYGEIRYDKVFQWCLARYGANDDQILFELQAARMRNCMKKRIIGDGFKPRYYTGNKIIEQIFSTGEIMDAVPSIQASMPKGALEDLTSCLHYSDNWDREDGGVSDDTYDDPKVIADPSTTAIHQLKHGRLEDGYKKLFARVYGGKYNQDIDKHNKHTVTKQKVVSLYDLMLDPYKHKGHCVVMDSAYKSDAVCQVGREEWKINMVGTCQTDQCGAGQGIDILCLGWAGNNFMKTFSNFHSADLLRGEMKRKSRNLETKSRDREFSDVNCPMQQQIYCCTYHYLTALLIDKENGAEAKYDMLTEFHLHGWSPKLAAHYFNMNLNNAYKVYKFLYNKDHPGVKELILEPCISNLTRSLLQQGPEMRQRGMEAPPSATKNLDSSCSGNDRKVRSDAA
ncbi:hypothetical protein FRACYDRAFT_234945 [Fragilariopsis cylindrus CCMP1102]|uniref:PiggyBac transposable element-derived protein domain-containing protein n=1 Tax=Fragilariopsis cylindrus CCMP1102 TaxID=635003 RepID=A0A1E7FT38_9STRA|nr:hypothetical protein FRACYDRAFT_234945 [Fragilariopsis cylindrus CCMP1102]|eukprot:OEU21319.1 hypothetical protein FRACYDRAFT_234945 [Fragilariopsis cylindrus CCMP1102]